MSKQTTSVNSSMALEQRRGALGKVTIVVATKLKSFSLLPVHIQKPTESRLPTAWENKSSRLKQTVGDLEASKEKIPEDVYKADIVHVREFDRVPHERSKYSETKEKSSDKPTLTPFSVPAVFPSEKGYASQLLCPVTMDDNKPSSISQLDCHNNFQGAEVNSNMFLNKSKREEEVISPVSSIDLLTTASSRESILSDGWEKERSWSVLPVFSPCTSPMTFSHTVSPCSSVRSGSFTPSVIRINSHSLAPASSLVQKPPTSCKTLGCGSRAASPCPLSGRGKHRLPPTHLSLLTAILRKGRLPILSPALQRPYSPCWPVSPITMSSCSGCTAASALPPMVAFQRNPNTHCSHNTKPQLLSETLKMFPKEKKWISATPLVEPSDAFDSFTVRSRSISSPDDGICLNKPRALTFDDHPLAHLSKEIYVQKDVPTVPIISLITSNSRPNISPPNSTHFLLCTSESKTPPRALSEHSALSYSENSKGQEYGQKSDNVSSILETAEPSHLKCDASAIIKHIDKKTSSNQQSYDEKFISEREQGLSTSSGFRHSPFSTVSGSVYLACAPPVSPGWTPLRPSSCSTTTERYTLPASSASPDRFLSPSPSYSLCSSSASFPRDDSPDSTNKNIKPYKIKSSYKAFAAIPTNKLLLEQQVIDDDNDNFALEDPHLQMCSPAELRQQSAELYQVINDVLKDVKQTFKTSHAKKPTVKSTTSATPKNPIPMLSPNTLGRETKYAHHQTPSPTERTLTRPGVIRRIGVRSPSDDSKARQHFTIQSERHEDSF